MAKPTVSEIEGMATFRSEFEKNNTPVPECTCAKCPERKKCKWAF